MRTKLDADNLLPKKARPRSKVGIHETMPLSGDDRDVRESYQRGYGAKPPSDDEFLLPSGARARHDE